MVAGIIGVDAINSTKVPIVTVWQRRLTVTARYLTGPSVGVTRLPLITADRSKYAGMGDRINTIRSTEVPIVTGWRRLTVSARYLTCPRVRVTRLLRRANNRGILTGIIGGDAVNGTEVTIVTE